MRFSAYQESKKDARRVNQDHMGYCFTRDAMLMVLCDGLGRYLLSGTATQQALRTMAHQFQHHARPSIRNLHDFLHGNIVLAHRDIHHYAETNGLPDASRTAVVCALTQHGSLHWAHAGDSHTCSMHKGELVMRARDHSEIENLLQQDCVPPVQVANHPEHNKVYNRLGSPNLSLIDTGGPVNLEPGDVAVLCFDGLWDSVQEDELIGTCISLSVTQAIPELIVHALHSAGDSADNTTATSMIWELDAMATTQNPVQADIPPPDAFTTPTLGAPQSESGLMSEEEIKRSVAEIHAAIDKTSNLTC